MDLVWLHNPSTIGLETGHWTLDWRGLETRLGAPRGLALHIEVATSIVCRYAIVQDVHCTDVSCKLCNGLSSMYICTA